MAWKHKKATRPSFGHYYSQLWSPTTLRDPSDYGGVSTRLGRAGPTDSDWHRGPEGTTTESSRPRTRFRRVSLERRTCDPTLHRPVSLSYRFGLSFEFSSPSARKGFPRLRVQPKLEVL